MRTIYGDHKRLKIPISISTRDIISRVTGAARDEMVTIGLPGVWRANQSGHRMGTAEVESALVAHESVAEAAVVGFPHEVKGEGIYAYVTLNAGVEYSEELRAALKQQVREVIGPIATPDSIHWAPALPKTRSGKIMRRILRKIATGETDQIGDVSTLADPGVVESLIENR